MPTAASACHLHLALKLPSDLPSVTQHYVNFVRCDDIGTANKVKDCMQQQWNELVHPGCKVKVKFKDEIAGMKITAGHRPKSVHIARLAVHFTLRSDITAGQEMHVRLQ